MDITSNTAVVSLTSHKINSQARIELDGVRRSLSMLSWDLQTQQVLLFSGLSVSENLLNDNVALSSNSNAALLGHTSLKDLVTRSEGDNGLGLDWTDFNTKMTALVNRQKYAIAERDFREINALVEDATTILGHKPADVAEFHSAKQRALQEQVTAIARDAQIKTQDLQEKNATLMRSLTDSKAEISGLHDQNKSLMQESAERIASMTREMAMNQEVFERKANDRIKTESQRLQAEFDQALVKRESEVSMRVREMEDMKRVAESRFNEIQAKVDRGELVSVQEVQAAHAKLDEVRAAESGLRNQLLDMNTALTESQKLVQSLRDQNAEQAQTVDTLNTHIGHLENRLREIMEDKMGSSEFAVLQERLTLLREERAGMEEQIRTLSLSNEKQSRQFNELRGRFQEMRKVGGDHLKSLNEQLQQSQERQLSLSTSYAHAKIVMIIMSGLAMTATGAFLASVMGIAG